MKHKKLSFYLLAAVIVFTGCKKQLQQDDPDVISEVNAFQTFDHVQLGLNGAYGLYPYANDMYISALLSDEAKIGAGNAGQGALTYRYQYSSDNTTGGDVVAAYFPYYKMIDQINRVLPHVYTVTALPSQEYRRDIVKGQLLALRAIAHFSLLEMYGYTKGYDPTALGVPYMTVYDPAVVPKPSRPTMLDDMTAIENDLATAKGLLPAVTPATFSDTVMNKVNIAAYQARIALYKKDYQEAVNYATEEISSNFKPLVSGAAFTGIWTDVNANETLFRIRFATSSAIGALWTTTGGLIYIAPSDKLVASYSASDIRLSAYIGTTSGNTYVNKFYTSSRGGRVVDLKASRISEMYLIRAEAYAKLAAPNIAAGTADLNAVRAARITGYTNVTFPDAASLIDAVLTERFKELCFEGFRFFDLKRNNLPVQRLASDASAAWQTLPIDSYRWVLPIPQTETLANPNMQQNQGY